MVVEHPVMALDHGDARIGVAATDPVGILAHPVESIHLAQTEPLQRIRQLVEQRLITRLIIGLPVRMDGTEGTAAEKVRKFASDLEKVLPDTPFEFVDERLTTVAASEKLRSAGKRAKKQRPIIDQAAAVEILNTWLDAQTLAHRPDDG